MCGGFIANLVNDVGSAVSDVGSAINDVASPVISSVENLGQNIIDTVKSNPLAAAALIAGGYYFAPELGAWIGADGTALAGTAEGVAAGTTPTTATALSDAGLAGVGSNVAAAAPAAVADIAATTPAATPAATSLADIAATAPATPAATTVADIAAPAATDTGLGTGLTAGSSGLGLTADTTGLGVAAPSSALTGTVGTDLAALNTGVAALPAATTGSTLSSMLPYMSAGQAVTGLLQANAASKAADIQSAAAQNATALQGQMFNTINQQQAPYRTAGYQALNQIGSLGSGQYVQYDAAGNPVGTSTGSGYLTQQFTPETFQANLDPGYAWRLQQGQMANQRAANATGGGFSGNALAGLNAYTQGQASQEYQNAFNRFQTQRTNIYNTLAGIAGIGQQGQTATNTAAQNATNAATQLGVGSAAAQAAGTVGTTNAIGNAVSGIGNTYLLANLLNQRGSLA